MKNTFKRSSCFLLFILCFIISLLAEGKNQKKDFYQITIYNLKSNEQVQAVDHYLKNVYLPAMHRAGINKIGVFKPIANDTAQVKKIYVLIPFQSLTAWQKLPEILGKDVTYQSSSKEYTDAAADKKPFERVESILLEAFPVHLHLELPHLKSSVSERIYELRSYESPTEHLQFKKINMFNAGGEIQLFNRLGFDPVFYGKVLSGGRMPNFMYMPVFDGLPQRDAQWKKFGDDPQWKDISTRPENENKVSVSHIDSIIMRSATYSDF